MLIMVLKYNIMENIILRGRILRYEVRTRVCLI
nr:MAG TPA: hypothetical protein [Bacteriophage sp.]